MGLQFLYLVIIAISSNNQGMELQIFVGTYQGSLGILHSNLSKIVPIKQLQISSNSIKAICVVDHQKFLVAGGYDQQIRVIDLLNNYQEKVQAKENVGQVTKIQAINDRFFAVGVNDGTLRLWSCNHWSISNQARFHKKPITSIVTAKEGKLLITAGGSKIIVWSAQNLKKAHQYKFQKDTTIQNLKITQDMKFIFYSNSNNQLNRICSEDNGRKLIVKIPSPRKIQEFILFQNYIIIGNDIGQVMAWMIPQQKNSQSNQQSTQALTYENRIWFNPHESRIKSLKIITKSPQQSYLLVATAGGNLSLWDFPQFLQSVQNISQNYHLQGLKPMCQCKIKGRILCVDSLYRVKQDEEQNIQKQPIQQDNINDNADHHNDQKIQNKLKNKKIKKKDRNKNKMQQKVAKNNKNQIGKNKKLKIKGKNKLKNRQE